MTLIVIGFMGGEGDVTSLMWGGILSLEDKIPARGSATDGGFTPREQHAFFLLFWEIVGIMVPVFVLLIMFHAALGILWARFQKGRKNIGTGTGR